ncbi:MAG TPA: hypothetical protein VGB85_26585 [Nannocystis sp.]
MDSSPAGTSGDPGSTSTSTTGVTTDASATPTTTDEPVTTATTSATTTTDEPDATTGSIPGWPLPEEQPAPAEGGGVSDPPTNTLHNHMCAGVDWQRIHGWLLLPHAAPELGPPGEIERCVERYAGWVTNEADAAMVSRGSVYAALAASGQCDEGGDYTGTMVTGAWCAAVNPGYGEAECLAQMAKLRSFGVRTLAQVIGHPDAVAAHAQDIPLMAAFVGSGEVACGGDDRWKLAAPEGYVDRYVAAYNAYKAQSSELPACSKRIVVSVALYTGLDTPGVDGVTGANGCWTYERVAKQNEEWKICNFDGTISHANGNKWAYDDTSTNHNSNTEKAGILACQQDVPGRGYVYMTNRGSGWPKVVTEGVEVHFAEIYSGQFAVDDQFNLWKGEGAPGEPMVNFGEPSTGAATIAKATQRSCDEVEDGGYLGVYVYPESLRAARMSAMVEALNTCTGL